MDITEDFKDVIYATAVSFGYTESEIVATMSSSVKHKVPERTSFTENALRTLEGINELKSFIVKNARDYVDLYRTTEQEKDDIEQRVSLFIKDCKSQIEILQKMVHHEEKNGTSRSWLKMSNDISHADAVAHKHGMLMILKESLYAVTSQFDRLKYMRNESAINRLVPRRKPHRVPISRCFEDSISDFQESIQQAPVRIHDQLLDDETRALQVELSSLIGDVEEIESTVMQLPAMSILLSTQVSEQVDTAVKLCQQAVEAGKNMEKGNKELSQATKRNSCSRTTLVFFMLLPTVSLLFLDWYNS